MKNKKKFSDELTAAPKHRKQRKSKGMLLLGTVIAAGAFLFTRGSKK